MAYNKTNDTGSYTASNTANSYYTNSKDLTAPATRAFAVTAAAAELTRYAKKLHIYVPSSTATGTVTLAFLGDLDNAPVTLTYGPGTYTLDAFVRRITAITGAGVVVTAFTD